MLLKRTIRTTTRDQLLDITGEVQAAVTEAGCRSAVVTVFVPHTTAGLTINENADPSVVRDLTEALARLAERDASFYRHAEGNSDAHIKSSLIGCSLQVLVERGKLQLGTWQGLFFCEFDGPRRREVWIQAPEGH